MEFDVQTIGYACGAVLIIVAGFFVGLWILGILVVGSLVLGGYLYFKNPSVEDVQKVDVETKAEIEALKKKALEGIEELQRKL